MSYSRNAAKLESGVPVRFVFVVQRKGLQGLRYANVWKGQEKQVDLVTRL